MRKLAQPTLIFLALAFSCFLTPHAFGQSVISARSGLVNYFEGVVFLDGQPLERKAGMFPRMHEGSTLLTEDGRAEVLLTPDTYLRIGANSSIRMISSDIDDTKVELLSGSSILDSEKAPDGAFVKILYKDTTIRFPKQGNFRIDADPPQLRVYQGEAEVMKNDTTKDTTNGDTSGSPVRIASSQLMPLDGAPVVKRFTQGSDGLLDIWSAERGLLIASNLVNSQAITDPLIDTGNDVPADLASYIGYMPVVIPPVGLNPYGYGFPYPSYSAFSPYPNLAVLTYSGLRTTPSLYGSSLLYRPRPAFTSIYTGRTGFPSRVGIVQTPRPITMPRPVITVPRAGVGVIRGVGRR
jgi:hypothetical protein